MRGIELGRSEYGFGRPTLARDLENDGVAAVTKLSDIKENNQPEKGQAKVVFTKDKSKQVQTKKNK